MFKKTKKIIICSALTVMMLMSSMPVSAKTCSYEYDQKAIGYGNINKVGTAYTYSQYVLGANAGCVAGIAKYSVGKKGSFTNVMKIKNMTTTGRVVPGTTKTAGNKDTVTICLYKGYNKKVASVSDK
jgi:hypothetical protein